MKLEVVDVVDEIDVRSDLGATDGNAMETWEQRFGQDYVIDHVHHHTVPISTSQMSPYRHGTCTPR